MVRGSSHAEMMLHQSPVQQPSRGFQPVMTQASQQEQSASIIPGFSERPPGLAARGASAGFEPWQARLADLHAIPVPSEDALRRVFKLTRAEARLAQGVARGDSLEDIAQFLDIRISTARTQLASIFAKTETRRQAKLAAMLGRLAHLCR